MTGKQKPSWWLVYLMGVATTGLLTWDYAVPRTQWLQKGAAVLLVIVFSSLVAWWLRVNHAGLAREDEEKCIRRKHAGTNRTMPLTPTQITYLKTMERYTSRRQT